MKKLISGLFATALLSLLIVACTEDNDATPKGTFARFNATQDFLTVTFANESSADVTSFSWDFGNGESSTQENPSVTYNDFGSYDVTLTVQGSVEATATITINVAAPDEDGSSFREIGSIAIGGEGAAEISAYDAANQQLFVQDNENNSRIVMVDMSTPSSMTVLGSIDASALGGGINSVAVYGTWLAAGVEADDKQANGTVELWTINGRGDVTKGQSITAGALPDMVTFTPDGNYILVANEGEPSDDYTVDPEGSVSIISTSDFSVRTVTFTGANPTGEAFRNSGTPSGDNTPKNIEPEYITVSADSKTAFVALQENNGLAVIDVDNATLTSLVGLGKKDYSAVQIDPSDEDGKIELRDVPAGIFGIYMPDAIAAFNVGGADYVISANEGDGREYFYDADEATCTANGGLDYDEDDGCLSFTDEDRLDDVILDPTVFPNAADLQLEENFGRLKLMITDGDTDGDGDFDEVWSFGARSFSIWDATGALVWDSGDELDRQLIAAGLYDDGRSDDKAIEPEGVVVGVVGGQTLAFVGLERVDAVAVYDVSVPAAPLFLSVLEAGDAPEGLVFVETKDSPTRKSLVIVSSEDDGTVKVYEPAN